VGQFLL
ncbi:hypothetical protein A2U01_0109054, partial [Trifolium medium]|nr:hypothetical protein [Trifolium medium]